MTFCRRGGQNESSADGDGEMHRSPSNESNRSRPASAGPLSALVVVHVVLVSHERGGLVVMGAGGWGQGWCLGVVSVAFGNVLTNSWCRPPPITHLSFASVAAR